MPRILVFAGSTRRESYNKKLSKVAAQAVTKAGGEVTWIDLKDYEMPLYNGDLEEEQGIPANARKLKELFKAHQGMLISCPEYNSSITPLLKNTIDWLSRKEKDEPSLAVFNGKVAGLVSASPGALGGLRSLVTVRSLLGNIGVIVLPIQVAVGKADQAFNSDGALKDPSQQASIDKVAHEIVKVSQKLSV
ncbi:MAG: NAD(P)H-dependent oxidoreductase [Chthoniobacteraceae bacterium]